MQPPASIITADKLEFGYSRKQLILRQLNLDVPRGAIYGFLGANGAGKSTTIRAILGLLHPRSGRVKLFGKDLGKHRMNILKKTGALIEEPSLYKHLSGYDNLRIACRYLNLPQNRIDEVLELVQLSAHRHKPARQYSTGMKQRLGIALAMLNDPELLILDEPVNGLDPNGIIEIRHILRNLNEQGKTIFLSSHLLSEIERIATRVGIVKDGATLFEGTIEELEQVKARHLSFRLVTSNPAGVIELLNGDYPATIGDHDSLEVVLPEREMLPLIIERLTAQGIRVYEASQQKSDLENLFIHLTENQSA